MRRFKVFPGTVIFTNIVQVCFDLKKPQRALRVYDRMVDLKVQGDHVFF